VREYTAKACSELATLVNGLARGAALTIGSAAGLETVLRSAEGSLDTARGQMQNWAAGEPDLDRPDAGSSALGVLRRMQKGGTVTGATGPDTILGAGEAGAAFSRITTDLAVICISCLLARRPLPALLPDLDTARKAFLLAYHAQRYPNEQNEVRYAVDLVSVALGVLESGDAEDLVALLTSIVGRDAGAV